MSKQDMLKVQTCVLRVNIHCDCEGCLHKVKKKLQKVKGVYKVSIDAEQGKVMVSGNADPGSLIEKLEKAGKHAELWGPPQKGGAGAFPPQKGGAAPFPISADQLKKFQMESFNKNNQKKGNEQQQVMMKNGFVQLPMKKGGSKDEKFQAKDHKSVRFDLPKDEEDDDYDDEDDDFDDEFDDDEDDDFEDEFGEGGGGVHSKPLVKAAAVGGGGQKPSKAAGNPHKGDKEGKAKKKGGGGGGIDMFIKGMLKKAGGKKGKSDKSSKKGESKKEDGGKNGGKKGGFELGDGKKGKNDDGWSKKAGENFHGGKQQHHHQQQQHAFNEMKANHKGGGGGRNMEMMGQMSGFPAVAGLPAMNGGQFAGVGPGMNPYNQQQYMAQMMMMNQQRENGHDAAYHPLAYARPPPAMSYGPPPPHMGYGGPPPMGYGAPPASGEYAHMFSDENTDSCGIM